MAICASMTYLSVDDDAIGRPATGSRLLSAAERNHAWPAVGSIGHYGQCLQSAYRWPSHLAIWLGSRPPTRACGR